MKEGRVTDEGFGAECSFAGWFYDHYDAINVYDGNEGDRAQGFAKWLRLCCDGVSMLIRLSWIDSVNNHPSWLYPFWRRHTYDGAYAFVPLDGFPVITFPPLKTFGDIYSVLMLRA